MDVNTINRADLGDFLYIIILAVLMIVGLFEKVMKAKRPAPPPPPHPYDDFEDLDEQEQNQQQQPQQPQTLEDLMRRMMQTQKVEVPEQKDVAPKMFVKDYYQPIKMENMDRQFPDVITMPEEEGSDALLDFEFDARHAIIASEILNRKY